VVDTTRTKLYYHLKKWLEKAVADYDMIEAGDKVLVGVSGGMDSLALLDLLDSPMVFTPSFSVHAAHVDMGFDPTYAAYGALQEYLEERGCHRIMEKSDIGPLAHSAYNKKNPCFLCSRLRRKRLFEIAEAEGCTKIALAHHRDDIIETLLINMFYGREISTMVPKQTIFAGKMHIIRPFAYIGERLVKKYGKERQLPASENLCPTSTTSRRNVVKGILGELEKDHRKVRDNLWRAMGHVKPDYLPTHLDGPGAGNRI
jgi:tRNA 2-thiocytidine biosynthesis protein TtcA